MNLVNGSPCEAVAVADRGLHYGDGLFETLAVTAGRPEHWQRHMQRLQRGCERLDIAMPDAEALWAEATVVCHGVERAVLKLIVTRGSGGRGYRSPHPAAPTRIMGLYPWPEYPEAWYRAGVRVRICRHRLSMNPGLAGIKHLNRLDQVLARNEWHADDIAEGLMLDPMQRIIEGTMSNLFVVKDGSLFTPDLSQAGIAGIMRETVMDVASEAGVACSVCSMTLPDLAGADELFLCNSIIGIWPVKYLVDTVFDAPGPLTKTIGAKIEGATWR